GAAPPRPARAARRAASGPAPRSGCGRAARPGTGRRPPAPLRVPGCRHRSAGRRGRPRPPRAGARARASRRSGRAAPRVTRAHAPLRPRAGRAWWRAPRRGAPRSSPAGAPRERPRPWLEALPEAGRSQRPRRRARALLLFRKRTCQTLAGGVVTRGGEGARIVRADVGRPDVPRGATDRPNHPHPRHFLAQRSPDGDHPRRRRQRRRHGRGLTRLHDTQCGLKVFAREAALLLFEQLSVTGFAFDVELLLFADRLGLRVEEVPVEWRHVEESRVRPLRDGVAMLRDALRLRLAPRVRRRGPRPTSMRDETFAVMSKLEREHWWFRAKRELAVQELRQSGT